MSIEIKSLKGYNRILIIGDAGVGKTTVANKIGQELDLPVFSTDDVLWIKKFSEHRDRDESVEIMKKIYLEDKWIVEGTTRGLLREGLSRAEIVLFFGFRNILTQYKMLIKRHMGRKDETVWNLISLLVHITKKRFLTRGQVMLTMVKDHPNVLVEFFPLRVK